MFHLRAWVSSRTKEDSIFNLSVEEFKFVGIDKIKQIQEICNNKDLEQN